MYTYDDFKYHKAGGGLVVRKFIIDGKVAVDMDLDDFGMSDSEQVDQFICSFCHKEYTQKIDLLNCERKCLLALISPK